MTDYFLDGYFTRKRPARIQKYELRGQFHYDDPSKDVPNYDDLENAVDYITEDDFYDYEE